MRDFGIWEATGLSRIYRRQEYIRDGEWEELASPLYRSVMINSEDAQPDRVTVDGRAWTTDIRFGVDRVTWDVTGKLRGGVCGTITATSISETMDRGHRDG